MSHSLDDESYETFARLCDGDADSRIEHLQSLRPADEQAARQQSVFKALANKDRIRVLEVLREQECCVCELQVVLDAPQSTVATHLRKLRDAGLVNSRKKGKWTYYRIADTAVLDLLDLASAVQDD